MKVKEVCTKKDLQSFYDIETTVYARNQFHRATEEDVLRLLINGPSAFHKHSSVTPFLLMQADKVVGRFAIIHDCKLSDYVQVSFFEAVNGLPDVAEIAINQAQSLFPQCRKVVIGLNGHVNYGAGFLMSHFDQPPVFGLPYTQPYYLDYFAGLQKRTMVSFRFPSQPFIEFHARLDGHIDMGGITVRMMNKRKLKEEVEVYTYLNNACFQDHPFWSNRTVDEDFELFHPFRFLLKEENLLFAELNGKPIGFLLWYPDFNQLVSGSQHLGLLHLLRYHLADPIKIWRFTEIGVLPKFRKSRAVLALTSFLSLRIRKAGYSHLEGGFIFEENRPSMVMVHRLFERATGKKSEPFRRFCVFESEL